MRPVDRAAVSYLDGLRVGHTNASCHECGGGIDAGEPVTVLAQKPRSRTARRSWKALIVCGDCGLDALPEPVNGSDEFLVAARVVAGPINASTLPTVTLANVRVLSRSLAFSEDDVVSSASVKAHRAAEGLE